LDAVFALNLVSFARCFTLSRDVCLTGEDDLISLQKGLELVDLLLKAGAEVNARDNDGKTPLMYMAKVKHRNYQMYDGYDCGEDEMFSAEIERKRNTDSLNYPRC
jgi:hypothetical protein